MVTRRKILGLLVLAPLLASAERPQAWAQTKKSSKSSSTAKKAPAKSHSVSRHHVSQHSPARKRVVSLAAYDDLYVAIADPTEKRKELLEAIKTSLVMQEESEKVAEIRKKKNVELGHIKTNMNKLNQDYQKLKKLLNATKTHPKSNIN